jgi:uncharacterized protein (TIGR00251 family)
MPLKVPRTSPLTEAPRPSSLHVTERDGVVRFAVQARPRARESRVSGVKDGAVVVQIAAPPVDGAANAELVATLARALGVAKRDVAIARGEGSRSKLVEVRGISAADVRDRLTESPAKR